MSLYFLTLGCVTKIPRRSSGNLIRISVLVFKTSQSRSILVNKCLKRPPSGWRNGVIGHLYCRDGAISTLKWREDVIWKTAVIVKMKYLRCDFVILKFNFMIRDVKSKQKPRLLALNSSFLFVISINKKHVTLNSCFLFLMRLKRKHVYSS